MKIPPDTSVGPLMDGRDRRERRRAWRMVFWPAFLFLLIIGGFLLFPFLLLLLGGFLAIPNMSDWDPFDDAEFIRYEQPIEWRAEQEVQPGRLGGEFQLIRDYSFPGHDPTWQLVDVSRMESIGKLRAGVWIECGRLGQYDDQRDGTVEGDMEDQLLLAGGVRGNLSYRIAAAAWLLDLSMKPWNPWDLRMKLARLDVKEGLITRLGFIPFPVTSLDISCDGKLALCERDQYYSLSIPRVFTCSIFPPTYLVSLPEGRLLGRLPVQGKALFISADAAVILSNYGVVRADVGTGAYQVVHPIPARYFLDTRPAKSGRYSQAGRRYYGAFFLDIDGGPPMALRIELSDPPRVEEMKLSLPDIELGDSHSLPNGPWDAVSQVNFARGLLTASLRTYDAEHLYHWYVIDAAAGRVVADQPALSMVFVGNDLLRVSEFEDLSGPPVMRRVPVSPALGAFDEGFMGIGFDSPEECIDGIMTSASDGQTTASLAATKLVPIPLRRIVYRYVPLDDLVRRGEGCE